MGRHETAASSGGTMSRPPRAEAPSVPITTRLSPVERDRVMRAARANHQSVSQFQRDALLNLADQALDDEDVSAFRKQAYRNQIA